MNIGISIGLNMEILRFELESLHSQALTPHETLRRLSLPLAMASFAFVTSSVDASPPASLLLSLSDC
jgi:hypothetical protein